MNILFLRRTVNAMFICHFSLKSKTVTAAAVMVVMELMPCVLKSWKC